MKAGVRRSTVSVTSWSARRDDLDARARGECRVRLGVEDHHGHLDPVELGGHERAQRDDRVRLPSRNAAGATPVRIASASTYELELLPRPEGITTTFPASGCAGLRMVDVDQLAGQPDRARPTG